jgi:hypothetical protein
MTTYTKADLALVSGMKKNRLREGCKAAGIKGYGNMNNDQMREALQQHIEANMAAPAAVVLADADNNGAGAKLLTETVVTEPDTIAAAEHALENDYDKFVGSLVTTGEPPAPAAEPVAEPAKPKTVDARNGVTRPIAGNKCAQVWAACEALLAQDVVITFAALRPLVAADIADATVRTQWTRFRKYRA